jgi:hypothetical protein
MPSRRKQGKPQQQKIYDLNNNIICEKGNYSFSFILFYFLVKTSNKSYYSRKYFKNFFLFFFLLLYNQIKDSMS